jgi:hypothetical protein
MSKDLPSKNDLCEAATSTPEQISIRVGEVATGILGDLIAGKNPLSSNTLRLNAIFIAAGIVGTVYQTWTTGDPAIAPLIAVATGAVNMVLRFLTTGPVVTQGMNKIMDALLKTNVEGN